MRISDWSSDVCSSDLFAVRRALDRGLSLGYLDAQLRLRFGDDQPNAVKTIIDTSRDPVTLERLRTELDAMAPQLVGRDGDGDGSLWTGLRRELGELRSEEHTSELQSLMRISYAVFCLKKKNELPDLSQRSKHTRYRYLHELDGSISNTN